MQLIHKSEGDTTLASGNRFVINLKVSTDSGVEVRSCEVLGAKHRNRYTFPSRVLLGDVFIDEVAAGITQCLETLFRGTEVVSLPSVSIELPGLTLARAHIIATETDDGLSVIVRFKLLLGGASRVFRKELEIEDHLSDHTSQMSAMVLTDIVMPLLDLCTAAENGSLISNDGFETFVDTLVDRSQEVRFQAELIKRFVASANADHRKAVAQVEDTPQIHLVSQR